MGEADIVRRGFAKKTGTDKYIPIIKNGGLLTTTPLAKSSRYDAPAGLIALLPMLNSVILSTFTTSTSNYPISQINMKEIDGLNYVKLDLLRLDTFTV